MGLKRARPLPKKEVLFKYQIYLLITYSSWFCRGFKLLGHAQAMLMNAESRLGKNKLNNHESHKLSNYPVAFLKLVFDAINQPGMLRL